MFATSSLAQTLGMAHQDKARGSAGSYAGDRGIQESCGEVMLDKIRIGLA